MKKHSLQAGALTYAIFIMLVTLIVIGTLITIAYYHSSYIERELARQNLVSYTNSTLTASVNDSTLTFPWDGKSINLTENPNYTFKVTEEPWGGYLIFTSTSSYGKFKYEKKVLCGAKGVLDDDVALYLTDNNNAISISGNTQLIGNCYLPKSGIKASYMEGDYYRGKQLVYGDILKSSSTIPAIDNKYLSSIKEYLNGKLQASDSIIDFSEINTSDFYNSFFQKTLYLVSSEPIFLNNCKFEGNIVIISSHPITIFSSAELIDIMLFAPKIVFKKNAYANIQAYAKDTLILEQGTHLTFPSTLGIMSNKNVGLLKLNRNTRVDGNIWITKNSGEKENNNTCHFYPESFLHGIAHIEGKLAMQGDIYGSLYTEKFFLKTVSSYYENHIYNTELNAYARLPFYASATLNKKRSSRVIKTLGP